MTDAELCIPKSFRHSGSLGDVVFAVPAIKSQTIHGTIHLAAGVPGHWAPGIQHPAGKFRMSKAGAEWLVPLLNSQPGLTATTSQEPSDVNLDKFRHIGLSYMNGSIPRWYFYVVAGWYDLSRAWLTVTPKAGLSNTLCINRTSRYNNPRINWSSLREYATLFVGLEEEYEAMRKVLPDCRYQPTADALEMAQVIAGCRVFVGGQSVAFAIAEALKCPRVLEQCTWCPNVIPAGGRCYDVVSQAGFDFAVKDAWNACPPKLEYKQQYDRWSSTDPHKETR
jgi:hypothetical protein